MIAMAYIEIGENRFLAYASACTVVWFVARNSEV